jgi:hypothetical protein
MLLLLLLLLRLEPLLEWEKTARESAGAMQEELGEARAKLKLAELERQMLLVENEKLVRHCAKELAASRKQEEATAGKLTRKLHKSEQRLTRLQVRGGTGALVLTTDWSIAFNAVANGICLVPDRHCSAQHGADCRMLPDHVQPSEVRAWGVLLNMLYAFVKGSDHAASQLVPCCLHPPLT